MVDNDWRYEELKRGIARVDERVGHLEKRLNDNERRASERSLFWLQAIIWALNVAFFTTTIVLAITHNLHHH
jgi:hypothetical protein